MTLWNVYLDGEWLDAVFFNDNLDEDYVKNSLIEHDNYTNLIAVVRREPMEYYD